MGIISFGIVVLFGPFLFHIVFGSEWIVAGEYARWISLWSFLNFINKTSVRSLVVLNSQGFHLLYTIFTTIVRATVLAVGFFLYSNDIIAVALFGISGVILNVGLISITLNISRKKVETLRK